MCTFVIVVMCYVVSAACDKYHNSFDLRWYKGCPPLLHMYESFHPLYLHVSMLEDTAIPGKCVRQTVINISIHIFNNLLIIMRVLSKVFIS